MIPTGRPTGRPTHSMAEIRAKFERDTRKGDGCWIWRGATNRWGYGRLSVPRTMFGQTEMKAHRLSWILANGPIPDGMAVCHRCDVRNCVRIEHLFLGTAQDNSSDMRQKGRSMRGTKNPSARLTEEQVRDVMRRLAAGERQCSIVRTTGIPPGIVCSILKGRTWGHLRGAA